MSTSLNLLFWFSQAVLLISKAPDLWTTYRFVGQARELNPIGRWLFQRFGLVGGLAVGGLLHAIIVSICAWMAWQSLPGLGLLLWSAASLWIAWIHLEVARVNAGGRLGMVTGFIDRTYRRWSARLERFGRH